MKHFLLTCNKQKLLKNFERKNAKIVLINKGWYEYGYFNSAFLNNMLSLAIDAMYNGYIPVIQLDGRKQGWTNWDTFFNQPFENEYNTYTQTYSKIVGLISPSFRTPFRAEELRIWSKIYNDFAVLNADTQKYVNNEYENLIKNKKVLGVLCRGTDYVQKRPYRHPMQPKTEDVITLTKQKMSELNLDYIYLATEEYRIVKQFEAAFQGKIITNKRYYYDEVFYGNNYTDIYEIHNNRANEIYERGIEYLSSIWLLSRCDALVAGNCGGSTSALYWNNGNYRYWHLFDLGFYGIDDKKETQALSPDLAHGAQVARSNEQTG
jgi:hypothetical protein